jgi:hypothetical protein
MIERDESATRELVTISRARYRAVCRVLSSLAAGEFEPRELPTPSNDAFGELEALVRCIATRCAGRQD